MKYKITKETTEDVLNGQAKVLVCNKEAPFENIKSISPDELQVTLKDGVYCGWMSVHYKFPLESLN